MQRTILYFAQNELQDAEHEFDFLNLISDCECDVDKNEIENDYVELLGNIQEKHMMDGKDIDLELVSIVQKTQHIDFLWSLTDSLVYSMIVLNAVFGTF